MLRVLREARILFNTETTMREQFSMRWNFRRLTTSILLRTVAVFPLLLDRGALAGDWTTYRSDNARSGITAESVRPPLGEEWVFESLHAPRPAWSPPQPKPVEGITELPRVRFDDAFHVVAADGCVYFGSSADHLVYALEVATGEVRWTFVTGGPVRLAPTWWGGKVFVGSDDGFVYCLEGSSGKLVWKFRAAPADDRLLGSGKMISLWPVRTGVLVDDGTAYFAAGIFPGEGLFLYAVKANDGTLVWRNDSFGQGGMREISPQGYMLASADKIFVASGRSVPAAFDRRDGRFLFQRGVNRFREGPFGGTDAVLAGGQVFSGTEQILTFDESSGAAGFAWFQGRRLVVAPETYYLLGPKELIALDRRTYPAASRKRQDLKHRRKDLTGGQKTAESRVAAATNRVRAAREKLEKVEMELEARRRAAATGDEEYKALVAARRQIGEELEAAKKSEVEAANELKTVDGQLRALVREEKVVAKEIEAAVRWRIACECPDAMVLAGDVIFAGGQNRVIAVDAQSGEKLWETKVKGKARGLAAAGGRLCVSTDTGAIHCFGRTPARTERHRRRGTTEFPYPRDDLTAFYEAAASRIVKETGLDRGYCLVLGGGTGRLAYELATRSQLMIQVVEPDMEKVRIARKALVSAGIYGARVCVDHGSLTALPYSDYFANLIVCEAAAFAGTVDTPPNELLRMLKPLGGVAYIGLPGGAGKAEERLEADRLQEWMAELLKDGSIASHSVTSSAGGAWATVQRGALEGAGSWTHQYADPGNTTCSDDLLVKGPLGLLWFGDPGPTRMVNRHASAAAPVSIGGRLFVQGENIIMAYDAYNGLLLWEREIPGAMRTGLKLECGNLAASEDSLFVAVGERCLRLDQRSGQTTKTYSLPPAANGQPRRWGYVAHAHGLLFGGRTSTGILADRVFAVDPDSGQYRWEYDGKQIMHATVAIGDGQIHFVEKSVTKAHREQVLREKTTPPRLDRKGNPVLDARLVVALDVATGQKRWERPLDFSDSVKISRGGGDLSAIYHNRVLLLFSAPWNGHFWTEFFAGEFSRRSLTALSSDDGKTLWSGKIGYRSRPLVVGDTIYAEPWARDLYTGERAMRVDPITGEEQPWQMARPGHHCGCIAASPSCLFFRSGCIGYYDLLSDFGSTHFSGIRPGCWINFIPANGVLLVPEASSGCVCPYPIHCTVAFKHRQTNRGWGLYSSAGRLTPVRRLGVNLGAPGDRRDGDGTLWLAYPRPRSDRLVLDLPLEVTTFRGGGYYENSVDSTSIEDTSVPWIFASGCSGIRRCLVPVVGDGEPSGIYSVRLLFAETEQTRAGQRVFDIKIQGKVLLRRLDIAKEAGRWQRAVVKEFHGIEVIDDLEVELAPAAENPTVAQAPVLSGLELIRTRKHPVSLGLPFYQLNDVSRSQAEQVELINHTGVDFTGVLEATSPDGFLVEPSRIEVTMAPGSEKTVDFRVTVTGNATAGDHQICFRLLRGPDVVEMERTARIRYTGRFGEATLQVVQDAAVQKKQATKNLGIAATMWSDGGDRELGDGDHAIVYYKFRLTAPGKPLAVKVVLPVSSAEYADSVDAGHLYLVESDWDERTITYANRPRLGPRIGSVGRVARDQRVVCPLEIDLEERKELSIAVVPTNCDGAGFCSRESKYPAELIVEYELEQK